MTLHPARLVVLLFAAASIPAFAQTVATVNGKAIPSQRLDLATKQVVAQYRGQVQDSPQVRTQVKEQLIDNEVMAQEAEKLGLAKQPEVTTQIEMERQSILLRALAADFVKKHPVSDAELAADYAKYKAEIGDKEYHIRHILVDKEDDAKAIITKLKTGGKFEELAKQSKDADSAGRGGDVDWVVPMRVEQVFGKDFVDAILALKNGQSTENPVKSKFGWHVVKLDDVRAARIPSMEDLKPQLTEGVQRRKFQEYGESLRKKAKIQ